MEKAKHTPGPWVAKRDGIQDNAIRIIGPNFQGIEGAGNYIAKMAWTSNNCDCTDSSPEILANAILIAASPKLLEALETCHEALWRLISVTDISTRGGDVVEYYHRAKDADRAAKEAITMAKVA